MSETEADFFVLAHEPGHDQEALPLWASAREGLIRFDEAGPPVERIDLPDLPGVFQLRSLIHISEPTRHSSSA